MVVRVLEGVGGDTRVCSGKGGVKEGAAGELLGELNAEVLGAFDEAGGGSPGKRGVEPIAAAMKVDARYAALREVKHVVGAPKSGGKSVGDPGLAAVPAGVAFAHAIERCTCFAASRITSSFSSDWVWTFGFGSRRFSSVDAGLPAGPIA